LRLSAYHRLPEVPAGEQSGKVIDPWNPKQGRAT